MKKVLLTGGSGFIGRNIQESYLSEKYDIIAPHHKDLDLSNTEAVDEFFKHQEFDVVLHFATKPGHRNASDLTNLVATNIRIFENLERNKNHFGKLINAGSGAIYDNFKNVTHVVETDVFKNMGTDAHCFCKYVIHKQIEKLDNFVDLFIFGIFGKYEDYAIRFISNAICKTIFDLPITLRQNRKFSYLDIDDFPPIVEFFIENNPKYKGYNITPNTSIDLLDLAKLIQKISGKNVEINVAEESRGFDYYGDNQRLKAEIPSLKFTPIEKSVQKLYDWYVNHKVMLNKEFLLVDK